MSRIPRFLAAAVLAGTLWAQNAASPASGTDVANPPNSNPEASASGSTPSQAAPDSTTVVAIRVVGAIYPLQAEKNKLDGQVVVNVAISEAGDVESVEVVSGDPLLAQAAADAARGWKFKPFIRNGKPTKASTKLTINFVFRDLLSGQQAAADVPAAHQPSLLAGLTTVRISEEMAQKMVLQRVEPRYPESAKTVRIQGTVLMFAVIGKEGTVKVLHLVSGHPLLAAPSLAAVKGWRFRPYVLNGEPVEFQTTITVHFTLSPFPL